MSKFVFLSTHTWEETLYEMDTLTIGKFLYEKGYVEDASIEKWMNEHSSYPPESLARAIGLIVGGPVYIHGEDSDENENLANVYGSDAISISFPYSPVSEWRKLAVKTERYYKNREAMEDELLIPLRNADPGIELYEGEVDAIFQENGIRIWVVSPFVMMYPVVKGFCDFTQKFNESIAEMKGGK